MNAEEEKDPQIHVVDRRWWARREGGPAEDSTARKPTYVEDLEQRLAQASNQLQAYTAEHRRSVEEFEQVKARLRRDVTREVERGKRAVIVEFLAVVDNLDRAIAASEDAPGAQAPDVVEHLARGVRLVRDQFFATLERLGAVRLPALGERFDAAKHEAIATAPVTDPAQDGTVIAVLKEGFVVGDDLLRPASVVVGRVSD
jgi:molecular chaperone GrpE